MHSKTVRRKKKSNKSKFVKGNNINNWLLSKAIQDSILVGFLTVMKTPITLNKFQKKKKREKVQLEILIPILNTGKHLNHSVAFHISLCKFMEKK